MKTKGEGMNESEFLEILSDDEISGSDMGDKCNALAGLKIIQKYLPNMGVEWASHDIIGSTSIGGILKAGITKDDATTLSKLNWMEHNDSLACFV